jgi:hypothetical protein
MIDSLGWRFEREMATCREMPTQEMERMEDAQSKSPKKEHFL